MTRSRRIAIVVAAIAVSHFAATEAFGDGSGTPPLDAPLQEGTSYLHLRSSADVKTDGGSQLRLPPGYYLDEPSWTKLDAEFRRLQTIETRLTAENRTLREATAGWQPGWRTIAVSLAAGIATGVYLGLKL